MDKVTVMPTCLNVIFFQDPLMLHKKFISECYTRLEVGTFKQNQHGIVPLFVTQLELFVMPSVLMHLNSVQ